jgi:TolB-like protein/Tfp pilus assembly protein PilF
VTAPSPARPAFRCGDVPARAFVLCTFGVLATVRPATAQCPDGTPPPCSRAVTRTASPATTSVAVLYFDNLSRDTADVYVADGLTEELIARLGQIERLQVKSRTAVQRYRGRPIDDPTVLGRTLGVAHLVSGSVRRGSGRLRVTVELTRASTGVRVWGNSYERSADDLMAVEGDIAQAIAEGIGGQLAPAERRSLTVRLTADPAAYDRLLRGNFHLSRRTGADARRAIAEYEAAVQIDPSLAPAWARIGLAYYLYMDWAWFWPGLTTDSFLVRGFAADDRALALDSTSSDAWMVRGLLLTYRDPLTQAGAVEAMERAVQIDPRNAEAWHQLGGVLMNQWRDPVAARRAFDRALALDPQRMITLVNVAALLTHQDRDSESLQFLDSAVSTNPDAYYPHIERGWRRLLAGNVAGARADADTMQRLRPADFILDSEPLEVALMAAHGDSAGARARAERLGATVGAGGELGWVAAYWVAMGFVAAGENDRAIATLERSRASGVFLWWNMRNPVFAPLRGDPRYQRLQDEVRPPWAR